MQNIQPTIQVIQRDLQFLALKGLITTQDLSIYQKTSKSNLKLGGKGQSLQKSQENQGTSLKHIVYP